MKFLDDKAAQAWRKADLSPRPHQQEVLPFIIERDHSLLLWGMRSGKTYAAACACKLRGGMALVVCPAKVVPVWEEALARFGVPAELIVSAGLLSSPAEGAREKLKRRLIGVKFSSLVVDEIHFYRDSSSRTKLLISLARKIPWRLGLTGTPFDSNLLEMFYPAQILDQGALFGTSRMRFYLEHGVPKRPNCRLSEYRPRDEGALRAKIEPMVSRFLPDLDHPEAEILLYKLQPRQIRMIRALAVSRKESVLRDRVREFGPASLDWKPPNLRQKAEQVRSGFYLDGEVPGETGSFAKKVCDSDKWRALQSAVDRGERTIVWIKFKHEYLLALGALRGMNALTFSEANLRLFREASSGALICHPRSAGCGIDVSCADKAVFASETASAVDNAQAAARLLAPKEGGRNKRKKLVYLLADDPHSQLARARLQAKQDNIRKYLGGARE